MLYLPAVRHSITIRIEIAGVGFTGINNAVVVGILNPVQQAVGIAVGIVKKCTAGVLQAVRQAVMVAVSGRCDREKTVAEIVNRAVFSADPDAVIVAISQSYRRREDVTTSIGRRGGNRQN